LLGAGFIVGGMNAIAGGGMLVGFPVLVALGLPPLLANATGSVITSPGQLASAIGYRNYLKRVPWRYAILLLPCFIGAVAGALTLRHTAAEHFARLVPVLVLFGVMFFALQPYLHFHLHRHIHTKSRAIMPLVLLSLALVPLSFYGGYFGPGFGFLMLAFLGFTNLRDTHMMNAMKNISAIVISVTSMVCLFSTHLIQWHTGLIMAVGAVVGGYVGARSAQKVSSHWLRIVIICIGLSAAVYLGVRTY
jgi:hypothetical protein